MMRHGARVEPSPGSRPEAAAAPPCPNCGYDLTGLTLPHRCPECGYLVDPATRPAEVRAWYCSWRGWLLRCPPPLAAQHLDQPECRRTARRRIVLGIVLPGLTAVLLTLGLNCLVVITHWERWYEPPERPGTREQVRQEDDADRLLRFNLDFGWGLFEPSPNRAVILRRDVKLSWPKPDAITVGLLMIPPAAASTWLVLWGWVRLLRRLGGAAVPRGAAAALSACQVTPYLAALVPLLGLAALVICADLYESYAIAFAPGSDATQAVGGVFVVALLWAGWLATRAVNCCRPRLRRWPVYVPLLVLATVVLVPPAVWFGLSAVLVVLFRLG